MREADELMGFDFRTLRMGAEEQRRLLRDVRRLLEDVEGVVFAYAHGSFLEPGSFRDLDVALWVKDAGEAFRYTVDLSARLEAEVGVPVDIHVLNEAPLPFKRHVFTHGELLLSSDDEYRLNVLDETLRKYFDLEQLNRAAVSPGKV